jgi:hypothetical protein
MTSGSNQLSFATKTQFYDIITLAASLAAATNTKISDGATNASVITDVLFKNNNATAYNFEVIICAPANIGTTPSIAQFSVPASAGTANISLGSLAALCPQLFDLDLAGNKCIILEFGMSLYIKNVAAVGASTVILTSKRRDF